MPLTLRRTPAKARYYTEVLEGLGEAIPLQMLLIPAGTFTMGSPETEKKRYGGKEGPQHEVTVPEFFMSRYPITQAQWRAVAGLTPVNQELNPAPSKFEGDNRPVERVTWYDAMEFCHRLASMSRRAYRLPTEAEWEYACRAGTTTPFHFGEDLTTEVANYNGEFTYGGGEEGENRGETTPVDHFDIANAFGLSDMHGNVLEWCADHLYEDYAGAPTDGSARLTDDETASRLARGGAWYDYPWHCRAAVRFDFAPDDANRILGFRVCCNVPAIHKAAR